MRVAALYDVHGNLPALEAVLAEVEREAVDAVVVGGDVATGPMPAETLDRLSAVGATVHWVRGNADRELVDAFDTKPEVAAAQGPAEVAAAWCAGRIERRHRDLLASFEHPVSLAGACFCHGSPRRDDEILTTVTPDERLAEAVASAREDLAVCGHTHIQFDRRVDRRRVVNAGSVGMPYEGRAGAYWLLLDPEPHLRRTDYDLDAAATLLRATGFPDIEEFLRESLLDPVDPDWVARYFEGLEAG